MKLEQEISNLKSVLPSRQPTSSYAIVASSPPSRFNTGSKPNSQHYSSQRPATPFRIIWGTQFSCTADVVTRAAIPLTPAGMHSHITVKRSVRTRQNGKHKWWFTIMAPAETLSFLDSHWDPLLTRAGWCLQSSLQPHSYAPGSTNPVSSHYNVPSGNRSSSPSTCQNRHRNPSTADSVSASNPCPVPSRSAVNVPASNPIPSPSGSQRANSAPTTSAEEQEGIDTHDVPPLSPTLPPSNPTHLHVSADLPCLPSNSFLGAPPPVEEGV